MPKDFSTPFFCETSLSQSIQTWVLRILIPALNYLLFQLCYQNRHSYSCRLRPRNNLENEKPLGLQEFLVV